MRQGLICQNFRCQPAVLGGARERQRFFENERGRTLMVGEQVDVAEDEQGSGARTISCLTGAEKRLERTDRLREGPGSPPEVERGRKVQSRIQLGFVLDAVLKRRSDIARLGVQ